MAEHGGIMVKHSHREADKTKLLSKRQGAHKRHKRVRCRIPKDPSPLRMDSKIRRHPEKSRQAKTATNNRKISSDLLETPH